MWPLSPCEMRREFFLDYDHPLISFGASSYVGDDAPYLQEYKILRIGGNFLAIVAGLLRIIFTLLSHADMDTTRISAERSLAIMRGAISSFHVRRPRVNNLAGWGTKKT